MVVNHHHNNIATLYIHHPLSLNRENMKHTEIEKTILSNLYEAYFLGQSGSNLNQIRENGGWDDNLFWKVAERMTHDSLIKASAMGGSYKITSDGILSAERQGLAPQELKTQNDRVRKLIMDVFVKTYEDDGIWAEEYIDSLVRKTGQDEYSIAQNIRILEDYSHIESTGGGYKITHHGLDKMEELRKKNLVSAEYKQIREMNPQARGRALQKLFAKIVEQYGWLQEEGVRTSHEEMDVIIYCEREYYLVECKWEKDSIEADVIRELYGKLGNRIAVHGIVVSMSGFTTGAVKQAEDYAGQKVILLFGLGDIDNMITGQANFGELLNTKYKELITHKKVVFA